MFPVLARRWYVQFPVALRSRRRRGRRSRVDRRGSAAGRRHRRDRTRFPPDPVDRVAEPDPSRPDRNGGRVARGHVGARHGARIEGPVAPPATRPTTDHIRRDLRAERRQGLGDRMAAAAGAAGHAVHRAAPRGVECRTAADPRRRAAAAPDRRRDRPRRGRLHPRRLRRSRRPADDRAGGDDGADHRSDRSDDRPPPARSTGRGLRRPRHGRLHGAPRSMAHVDPRHVRRATLDPDAHAASDRHAGWRPTSRAPSAPMSSSGSDDVVPRAAPGHHRSGSGPTSRPTRHARSSSSTTAPPSASSCPSPRSWHRRGRGSTARRSGSSPSTRSPPVSPRRRTTSAATGTVVERLETIEATMRDDFSLDPGAPGGGMQLALIQRFLTETRRGNAEQFATAFVLLARSLGVNARVATGFEVPADELDDQHRAAIGPRPDVAGGRGAGTGLGRLRSRARSRRRRAAKYRCNPPQAQTPAAQQPPIAATESTNNDDVAPPPDAEASDAGAWSTVTRWVVRSGLRPRHRARARVRRHQHDRRPQGAATAAPPRHHR